MKTLKLLLCILGAGLLCAIPAGAQAPATVLKQADAAWDEKSYARAIDLYRQAQKAGNLKDADEVEFRIATSLGKTEKWDDAIASGEALLAKTPWKARVLYWLGRLYTVVPHQGYKIGAKTYRGEDYPKTASAEKPVQVWLGEEDAKATLDYFERAKIAAQKERDLLMRARFADPALIHALSAHEEIDLNFDLAAFLPTREYDEFIAALTAKKTLDENVDTHLPYDTSWHLAKKVLYLYNQIPELDDSKDKHDSALGLLAKGLFVRSYRQRMDAWANQYDEKLQKNVVLPYPFDHLEPTPIWQSLVDKFPDDPIADRTQVLIAQTWASQGDMVKALAAYRAILDKFPKSKWVSDAKANIQQITRHEIAVDSMGQQKPGEKAKITVSTRNVKQVQFTAYKVKLEDVLASNQNLNEPNTNFTEFKENFGSIAAALRSFGPQVAAWTYDPKDKGDYQGTNETIDTPLQDIGAYAIVATSGDLRFARVLVISDLAILKKTDRDGAFAYIADARSGLPVPNANVVLKEVYSTNGTPTVDIARGTADEQGFFAKNLKRGQNIYSQNIAAFAWVNNRYALTGGGYSGNYYGDNRDELKVYAYTDRPVYRPGQKVYFRQILTQRVKGGDQQPAKGIAVTVMVSNPKGEEVYKSTITSSEFGTVNGEFSLPDGAPLGEYSINASVEKTNQNVAASGGNRFRVEEYKRPEFEVTVDAPDHATRPGETVAAKINARYYFGAPVPGAKVKFTVRRSTWWAGYHWPTPYDWLYAYWNVGDYDTGRRNIGGEGSGAIVKEGTVTTDAQGNAELSFVATKDTVAQDEYGWWWRQYSNPLYTIEAEVTDQSRRTIEGQGAVKVANQQYYAFLDTKQGYYQQGDRIPVELRTQDANDKPIAAAGKMVVYRLLPGDKEEKVFEEAVKTDAQGRAFWTWNSDAAGSFRVAYEATDEWNQKVVGSTEFWVAGTELNTSQFRLQGVTIILDQRQYEEGQTLHALLVADQPDTTLVLTQEAGGQILKRDLVHIEGKSKEITIPIRHEDVPNFAIAAALVKNFEVYQAQQEVFVPPVQQLIKVSVQGDKNEYKPGEKGVFTLKATDWQGKPARAEVSVALADASLFYIQKDYAPDIRTFYYGERRAIDVNLDSSRSGNLQGIGEDDIKYEQFEQHGWELPDDLGELNLNPGGWGYYPMRRGGRMLMRAAAGEGGFGGGMDEDAMATGAAAPMAAPAVSMAAADHGALAKDKAPEQAGGLAPADVRSNFAETAFWSPAVVTNNGTAKVTVTFPDSLTQWHASARGLTTNAAVGAGDDDVETKKNLLVRLQAPRFFVERDQVVLTANVHNYLKTAKRVKVSLLTDDNLKLMPMTGEFKNIATGAIMDGASDEITVKAGEEARINWLVNVTKEGDASVKMSAQTDEESDAVKMQFPVLVHGVQRFTSKSGVMKQGGASAQTISINIPKERRLGATSLNVQLNPSLAATMLDALPYLADYPYGCVEQTMSRFLPSVVAAKVLTDSGVDLKTLRTRAKAYEAEAKAQPVGAIIKNSGYSYPKGMPNSRDLTEMASNLWHTDGRTNPIYDAAEMQRMINEGLQRLYGMQRDDGGWGWWPESSESDEYMSAYVVYGLATARAAEVPVKADVLERGFEYLHRKVKEEDNLHLVAAMASSLALRGTLPDDVKPIVQRLFTQRERLSAYSRSLLAMALWNGGDKDKAGVLVRNLENTAVVDAANGTARWKEGNDYWWWWNNDVETNAVALRAFLMVDPQNKLVPMMMKWLTTQARGNHWNSTKETAEAVYALADYVRVNKELDVDYTVKVTLNGKLARTYKVNAQNALYFDNRFLSSDLFLQNGANTVTIEKQGKGNVYWSAASEYFSLEEPIKAAGNEIAIKRRFFKLTRNPNVQPEQGNDDGSDAAPVAAAPGVMVRTNARIVPRPDSTPVEQEYKRTELQDNAVLKSGDLIEVELTLDAANDYEYLVFEDMKAAGLEPVDLRSGGAWGDGLSSNVELRDDKVAFFVDRLPQGTRVLRYRMRAEVPGRFHALPTNGYAMYAPEVRAISDEKRLGVKD